MDMSSSRPATAKDDKSPHAASQSVSPTSPPQPHLDDQPHFDEAAEDDEHPPYPELQSEQTLLPPSDFNPFFTLVQDSASGEHHHPYVHYVFADDDPVLLSAAAMRSLGLDDAQFLPPGTPDRPHDADGFEKGRDDAYGSAERHHSVHAVESPLPPPIPGVKDRYLIVDVAAGGHCIVAAHSLSSEWQITNAHVRSAPTFSEESQVQAHMLSIEGVQVAPTAKAKGKAKEVPGEGKLKTAMENAQGDPVKAMDALVAGVENGLDIADKIMGRRHVKESEGTAVQASGATSHERAPQLSRHPS